MFVFFTPYTYIFSLLYFLLMLSLFSLSDFYSYWLVIELIALLLIGVSYTVFTNSVSQLMSYFLIQSLSSFLILFSYLISSSILLTISLLLKLGMFPFMSWYLNVVSRFPNYIFWLVGTVHKLPPLVILVQFNLLLDIYLFWGAVLLTTFIAGSIMLSTSDFRYLLVASSAGNNSWFLLSSTVGYDVFLVFLTVYTLFLFGLLSSLGDLVNPIHSLSPYSSSYNLSWSFFVLALSGLPPFPLFFANMLVIYSLFTLSLVNPLFAVFLLFNCLMVAGYLTYIIGTLVRQYSSPLSLYL